MEHRGNNAKENCDGVGRLDSPQAAIISDKRTRPASFGCVTYPNYFTLMYTITKNEIFIKNAHHFGGQESKILNDLFLPSLMRR